MKLNYIQWKLIIVNDVWAHRFFNHLCQYI